MRAFALLLSVPVLAQPADPAQAVIQEARAAIQAQNKAYQVHKDAGKPRSEFKWDFSKQLASVDAALGQEQPIPMKQTLLVARFGYLLVGRQKVAPEFSARIFAEVPATCQAWAIEPSLLSDLAEEAKDPKIAEAYLAEAREKNPAPEVRAYLLEQRFEEALDAKDETVWKATLASLERDHPESEAMATARKNLAEYQKTVVGKDAPAFELASMGDSKTVYTLSTFKGKYVLVDFWATWCPWCRVELPSIHKAYERFKGKGFEVLSLSFDQKPEDVAAFRKKPANPMTWKHAFLSGGGKHAVSRAYGVVGIPKAVLVGPDGKIVATDADVKGDKLVETLEKLLGS